MDKESLRKLREKFQIPVFMDMMLCRLIHKVDQEILIIVKWETVSCSKVLAPAPCQFTRCPIPEYLCENRNRLQLHEDSKLISVVDCGSGRAGWAPEKIGK